MPLEGAFTDPVDSTKAEFSRRGFVSLSAGAAFAAGNTAAATAQTEGFGKPHPPLVAEDDPAIVVSRPRLTPAAGGAIGAYAATPRTVKSTTPGVVVVMHAWGVDAQIRDTVRRYAKAGFIAVAPNLFERLNAPSGDGVNDFDVFRSYLPKLFAQGFVPTDVLAAHDWIPAQARDAAIGITGFCMGGGIVLQSIIDSKGFAAASMFYGNVLPGANVTTPLMGSFGARDTSIKPEDVRDVRPAQRAARREDLRRSGARVLRRHASQLRPERRGGRVGAHASLVSEIPGVADSLRARANERA